MPLERDEGEYAYAGQLILRGVPPYKLVYSMKLPGTYTAYALLMAVLGQTPAGIHLGLLLLNSATIALLYLLATELFGGIAGLVTAATYGLLSTSASVLGLAAHATHFVVFAAAAGLVVLLRAIKQKRLHLFFLSGILLGLAFLMKQPGILFGVFATFYVLTSEWAYPIQWKSLLTRLALLLSGIALPCMLTGLVLLRTGVFQKFWFWTVSYANQYGTINRFNDGLERLLTSFPQVAKNFVVIWLLAAAGATAFWWCSKVRRHKIFALGFLSFSFLAICPGFYFREHYFILMLPAVSLLVGTAVRSAMYVLEERTQSDFLVALPCVVFLVVFAVALLSEGDLLFQMDPLSASRAIYPGQPFPEASMIGDYVREHSNPSARIAVLGSEPEIYFYARRPSATGYIYTYPLMEKQPYASFMQNEMISEIETARPEFVVLVKFPRSWLRGPDSDKHILEWMMQYVREQYDVVGVADLQSLDHTEYRWDTEAVSYQPLSPYAVFLFRRHA
jgi:hypothetical protein